MTEPTFHLKCHQAIPTLPLEARLVPEFANDNEILSCPTVTGNFSVTDELSTRQTDNQTETY